MTAKSRRHKLDKKRKSDEHPHPRHAEEDRGRSESKKSRTGLIPRKREGDAADEGGEQAPRVIRNAKLHHVSLVPEGEGLPGSFVELVSETFEVGDGNGGIDEGKLEAAIDFVIPEDLVELHEVNPNDYNFTGGWPEGSRLYLNDSEKELFDRIHEERRVEIEEGVRTARAPHAKTSPQQ